MKITGSIYQLTEWAMLFAVKGRPAWVFLSAVEFERPEDKRVDPDREITVRIKRWVAVEKGWAVSSSQ